MANLIPWSEFEAEYASLFSEEMGAPAKTFRIALGALIIQERLGISDRKTVEQIRENPYLQYFIGLTKYQIEAPFDASMMVYFRKRIKLNLLNKINQEMVKKCRELLDGKESGDGAEERGEESERPNSGNQEVKSKLNKKPRTSRKIARKNYLKVAKKRRSSQKERRTAIGQQLGYIAILGAMRYNGKQIDK
ncbi:MAG: transposase [Microcystis aeruginosa W13-15]|nr:transposase [Microcystis aeruginosa W13-15]